LFADHCSLTTEKMIHKPVLLKETIDSLNLKPGITVVDGTLGAGGHSKAILAGIMPGGKLVSIDRDEQAVENFEKSLAQGISIAKRELTLVRPASVNIKNKNDDKSPIHFKKLGNRGGEIVASWCGVAGNYANLKEIIRGSGIKSIDAILLDLGFSSDQIEDPKRGFSFLKAGLLDMRYSPKNQKRTAADIVNEYSEKELSRIFRDLGEEKFAFRIAKIIAERRKEKEINDVKDLVSLISKAIPERYRKGRIHFATKIFQALRIETNQELENLKIFLAQSVDILASKGILAIVSFHSLEDRIVKNFFREEAKGCVCPPSFPKCVCNHRARLEILTRKPIKASAEEIVDNPRARSAKLRVVRKL
jgi:16S rRNA (cytosine1402-N4)-methyltransferase